MKLAVLLLAPVLTACAAQTVVADYQLGGPTADQVEIIESQVVMPADAQPLKYYLRTYFPDRGRIIGQYRLANRPGVRSQPTPSDAVMDGGCSVVTVVFNPTTSVVEDAGCNGVA